MSLKIEFITKEMWREVIPTPKPADNFFPEWFSQLDNNRNKSKCPFAWVHGKEKPMEIVPNFNQRGINVTSCPGIIDFLKQGYIIPSWDNFFFREKDGQLLINWTRPEFKPDIKQHLDDQFYTMPNKPQYGAYYKVETPWIIRTDPGVSCLITHPVWHKKTKRFTSATGVYHTDQSPCALKWFFEYNHKITSGIEIENVDFENQLVEIGDPLMLIIPFYRKKYEHEVKYVSDDEIKRLEYVVKHKTNFLRGNDPYTLFRKGLGRLFK